MRICSLAAISTESARSNAGVLAANFIGAGVNPDTAVSRNELSCVCPDREFQAAVHSWTVRAGAGSVHAKLAEPGSRPCALIRRTCFKAGLARERKDGASIRGHLVSSQFPWEVKFASDSPVEGDGFELSVPVREGQCSSRLARYGSNPFQTWKPVFGGSRKHFCCFTRTFSRRTIT